MYPSASHPSICSPSMFTYPSSSGYWGLRQVIDPWGVNDYVADDDEENTGTYFLPLLFPLSTPFYDLPLMFTLADLEYLEFMALKVDMLGELTRMEERLADVRQGVERAAAVALQSDSLLEDARAQSETELIAIGDEIRKMYVPHIPPPLLSFHPPPFTPLI